MASSYDYESFDNYDELYDSYPEIAQRLLQDVGEGDWQNEYISFYPSVEDFAEYELTEGWYIDCNLGRGDYNGAPDPLDYIDLGAFGDALLRMGDESVEWTDGECVITTSHGW